MYFKCLRPLLCILNVSFYIILHLFGALSVFLFLFLISLKAWNVTYITYTCIYTWNVIYIIYLFGNRFIEINSHNIQFTRMTVQVKGFYYVHRLVQSLPQLILEHFCELCSFWLSPLKPLIPTQVKAITNLPSVSLYLSVLDTSYEWGNIYFFEWHIFWFLLVTSHPAFICFGLYFPCQGSLSHVCWSLLVWSHWRRGH